MSGVSRIRMGVKPDMRSEASSAVILIDSTWRKKWDQFVLNHDNYSVYHLYDWRNLIERIFRSETYYFVALNDQNIVGVLPLVRLKSWLFGDFMVSIPYFNYGGILADNDQVFSILWESASALAVKLGVKHIEMRHSEVSNVPAPTRTDKVSMILKLPNTTDELFQKLTSKLRAQIKRSVREGATVHLGNMDLLSDFYFVFSKNMRDLGTPVYAITFFKSMLIEFASKTKIVVVRVKGKPVAAAFLVGENYRMEIPWASSLREFNHLSVNMLLYWEVLKYSIEHDYRLFDFGRCSVDSGTYKFKKQWGADPLQLYWSYWIEGDTSLPKLNPSNPKFKLLISVWKRLPLWFANWIGPKIVKNLP